jgi:hypothetical protein
VTPLLEQRMISVYLRNGDLAEVNADTIETRSWDLPDGSQANSVVCLDGSGEIVGQFFMDQIVGWMFSEEDDIFNFEDEEDD